jgi:hypothetical protein
VPAHHDPDPGDLDEGAVDAAEALDVSAEAPPATMRCSGNSRRTSFSTGRQPLPASYPTASGLPPPFLALDAQAAEDGGRPAGRLAGLFVH